jgi:TonB-dependent receptor
MRIDWSFTRVQTKVYNPYDFDLNFRTAIASLNPGDYSQVLDPKVFTENVLFNQNNPDNNSIWRGDSSFEPDSLKQINYIAKIDVEVPFKMGDKIAGFFKFGGKYQTESRTRSGQLMSCWPYDLMTDAEKQMVMNNHPRPLQVTDNGHVLFSNFSNPKGTSLLNGDYRMYSYTPESALREWYDYHYKVGDQFVSEYGEDLRGVDGRYYEATERVAAGYVMMRLNYGNLITLVPGLRYEYSDNEYVGVFSTISTLMGKAGFWRKDNSSQQYGEFLPSVHLKVKPTSWMDVRLSTVKTLSRPNYMWLLPRFRYNSDSYSVSKSNPDLKHATAWNYDASITVYTGEFGLMSFGGYIKNISNMFYQVSGTFSSQQAAEAGLAPQPYTLTQDYINLDDSYVRGLEFEYNTHFNFLPSPFNRFALGFNITRLWSGTYYLVWNRIEGIEMVRDRPVLGVDFTRSHYETTLSRMPSQVDWTGNAWLGYDFKGFSTRLSMAYQGTRLTSINPTSTSDGYNSYSASTLRIDFTARQRINRMVSVLLNLNNLTNETDGGYRYQSKYPTSRNMYGFTGELGVQINF